METNLNGKDPHQHLDEDTRKLLQVQLPKKSPDEMTEAELRDDIAARKILTETKKQLYERMRLDVEAKMAGLARLQATNTKNEAAVIAEKKRSMSAVEEIQNANAREMLDCQARSTVELLNSEDQKRRFQGATEELKRVGKELSKEKEELNKTKQELDGWRLNVQELQNRDRCILEQTRKLQARLDEVNAKTNRLRGNMRQALLIEKADPLSEQSQEEPSFVPDKKEEIVTTIEKVLPTSFSSSTLSPSPSSSVNQSLGHKSSSTTESAFEEREASNDSESYYEEDYDMDEDDQEFSTGEDVDEKQAIDAKETSEPPSTTSSDSSDIEILNDDQIPLPTTRTMMEPSPLLDEYEGCELYFSDLEGILGTGKMNDRLMDYSLATIWKKESREEIRDSTFVFPSLFYTRLIREMRQSESDEAKETATKLRERRVRSVAENFRGVLGFTKGVDIFEKEYLLVPVVECDHWYLIVIVNPSALVITTQNTIQCFQTRKRGNDKTTLIILDSLPRASDWRRDCVDRVLCLYLMFEHKRIHSDRPGRFEKTRMEVILPGSVPSQKNNVDCGFFVVRYAKTFLDRPPTDEMLLRKAPKWSDWFPRISAHPTQIRKDVEKRIRDGVDPTIWKKFEQFGTDPQQKNEDSIVDEDEQSISPISLCRMSLDLLDSCPNDPIWPEHMNSSSSTTPCESPDAKRRRVDSGIASPTPSAHGRRYSMDFHSVDSPSRKSSTDSPKVDATDIRKMKARDVGKWMAQITGDPEMEERCVQVGLRGAIVAKMDEQTLRSSLLLPEEMFAKVWADIARKP